MIEPGTRNTPEDSPLTTEVKDGKLIISIGIERLAFCFENSNDNTPFDPVTKDFPKQYEVVDQVEFANDVRGLLTAELGEDGSSLLSNLLDKACLDAIYEGSLGVRDIKLSS